MIFFLLRLKSFIWVITILDQGHDPAPTRLGTARLNNRLRFCEANIFFVSTLNELKFWGLVEKALNFTFFFSIPKTQKKKLLGKSTWFTMSNYSLSNGSKILRSNNWKKKWICCTLCKDFIVKWLGDTFRSSKKPSVVDPSMTWRKKDGSAQIYTSFPDHFSRRRSTYSNC